MTQALAHRGPDDEGEFVDSDAAVFLANRRLSIIDPAGGRQPVASEDGSVIAVQNGEIYNFQELRATLIARGHRFHSRTDSEVIPHLYEEYGEAFPRYLDGMFAIALYDAKARKFILARDHFGIKPLYIWRQSGNLAFASEVKALLHIKGVDASMDLNALHFLINIRFIPGRRSLFKGIHKLPPASLLIWENGQVREACYWRLTTEPNPHIRAPEDCVEETRHLLARAVKKQLISDVPLGLYLSGGIDSSSLVAMAAAEKSQIKTFSLAFNEPTDELADARVVADAFQTEHSETTIEYDALSTFPQVTWHVEEPKENAIQLYLLSRFASRHVKVALSGLGGDELFGGYRIFDYFRPLVSAHRFFGRGLNSVLLWPLRNAFSLVVAHLGSMKFDLAKRGMDYLFSTGAPERMYLILRNMWEHDRRWFRAIYTPEAQQRIERGVESSFSPLFEQRRKDVREAVLRAEFGFKMVDDFLLNEDRTSMANSLEVRVPFLDKDLVEFAFSIPASAKFAHGGLKSVLRTAMTGVLPDATLKKPKWGFTFDSFFQFQKDLGTLAGKELSEPFIRQQGIFNYQFIRGILDHPPHRWMRWHYFLLWLILGVKVWENLFVRGRAPEACYDSRAK